MKNKEKLIIVNFILITVVILNENILIVSVAYPLASMYGK